MIVRLTPMNPKMWIKNGANITRQGVFNELNAGVFLIDPGMISALGGTKSSQLSDSNFLSLRMTPSLDISVSASSNSNSSWSGNGWTVDNLQTFLVELATWCKNHFEVTAINQDLSDVNIILMQGKVNEDSETTYTVALAYFGNKGTSIALSNTVTLTVTLTGAGTGTIEAVPTVGSGSLVCTEEACTGSFDSSATVALSAVAEYNSKFVSYSGDLTSTSSSTNLALGSNKNVTANFRQTFNRSNGIGGSVRVMKFDSSGRLYIGGDITWNNTPRGLLRLNSDGTLDTSFNAGGTGFSFSTTKGSGVYALLIDASGNLWVGGTFDTYNGVLNSANCLAKLDSSGNLLTINASDTVSATGNGFNGTVFSLAFDSSGNIYAVGGFTACYVGGSGAANNANYIAKISSSGNRVPINASDTTSATGNGFSGNVTCIAIDSSDNVYVGGSFITSYVGGSGTTNNANYVAKINSSGTRVLINSSDTTSATGNGLNASVTALCIDSSQNLYIGGTFTSRYIGGSGTANNANRIAKINSSGVPVLINASDTTGASTNGFDSSVQGLSIDASGNLYVGGAFTTCYVGGSGSTLNTNYLAKLNSSGQKVKLNSNETVSPTGNGVNAVVFSFAYDASGNVYVGGLFTTSFIGAQINFRVSVVKLNYSGSDLVVDSAYKILTGINFNAPINCYAMDSSGNLWVGGLFTAFNEANNNANYIAKLDPDGNLLKINASDVASPTGNGFNSSVRALAFDSSGNLYAGGSFTVAHIGGPGTANNANFIAKINSSGSRVLINASDTAGVTTNGVNGTVQALAFDSSQNLYVGGAFTACYVGGSGSTNNANRLAKINSSGTAVKVNSSDATSATGNGFNNTVYAFALDTAGGYLYVGGAFTASYVGGSGATNNANRLAKISLSSGAKASINASDTTSATGNGFNNQVNALAFTGNDLYAGGTFTACYVGGSGATNNANYLAKISSGSRALINSSDTTSATGNGLNNSVSALAFDSSGNLLVGGAFTTCYVGGSGTTNDANRIVKLSSSGNRVAINAGDATGSTGNGFNITVNAIYIDSSNNMYVGGNFSSCYVGFNNRGAVGFSVKLDSSGNPDF